MRTIRTPDGVTHRFPSGATDDQIAEALSAYNQQGPAAEATRTGVHPAANRNLAWKRGAVGAIPAAGEIGGQLATGAFGGPVGRVLLGTAGGALGRGAGELVRRGVVAMDPSLGQPAEGGGVQPGMSLPASMALGGSNALVGQAMGGAAARIGMNAARRAFKPTPSLVKGYMKEGGKPIKDRLLRQAMSDKVGPNVEGVEKAGKLVEESTAAVDGIIARMRSSGRKVRLEDIAKSTVEAREKFLGRSLTAAEVARTEKQVAKQLDKIMREQSGGSEWAVRKVKTPTGVVTVTKRQFDPLVINNVRKAADEAGKQQFSVAAQGKKIAVSGSSPEAARLSTGARKALRMDPLGKRLELANRELQARMGVKEMVTNAAASSYPANFRLPLLPLPSIPTPQSLAYGIGVGLESKPVQGALRSAPSIIDLLGSYLGNVNPDTTETR